MIDSAAITACLFIFPQQTEILNINAFGASEREMRQFKLGASCVTVLLDDRLMVVNFRYSNLSLMDLNAWFDK